MTPAELAQALKQYARQLGFTLAGITNPQSPQHFDVFQNWLNAGQHAQMAYLTDQTAIERRADPRLILPECQSILVFGNTLFQPADFVAVKWATPSREGCRLRLGRRLSPCFA